KGGDFKARWGINFTKEDAVKDVKVVPGSIPPHESEVEALFNFFTKKEPLVAKKTEPTWSPTVVPEGFEMVMERTEFLRIAGMGETLTNLCQLKSHPIEFYPVDRNGPGLTISRGLVKILPDDWNERIQKIAPTLPIRTTGSDNSSFSIGLGESWRRVQRIQVLKKVLTSGLFPIWKLKAITPDTKEEWEERLKVGEKSYRSRVVVAA